MATLNFSNPWLASVQARFGRAEALAEARNMDLMDLNHPYAICTCGGEIWYRPLAAAYFCWTCRALLRK